MMLTEFKNLAVFDVFRLDGDLLIRYNRAIEKTIANCKVCDSKGLTSGGEWCRVADDTVVELINNELIFED